MLKPYKRAELAFEEVREIGAEGRNSRTFVVNDRQLAAEIVMKQMRKEDFDDEDGYFAEARTLYAVAHQNVVQVIYACEDEEHIYVAMPLYRNGSVKAWMGREHLTVREIVRIGCQVLSGLHNIHAKGLIHFDIKPDNILLSDRREALLSDFGLARHMNEEGLAEIDQFYTPMVPPDAVEDDVDLRYDIYQFGLTLYRMANGDADFARQFRQFIVGGAFDRDAFYDAVAAGRFPDRSNGAFPHHIPAKLRTVIKTCLEPEPAQRYGSALQVANTLADVEQCLDWRFSQADGNDLWIKEEQGRHITITRHPDGSTTCLRVVNGGRPSRVRNACLPAGSTKRDVERILRETK